MVGVQGEQGKVHGAEEADMRSFAVQYDLVGAHPQTRQGGVHIHDGETL